MACILVYSKPAAYHDVAEKAKSIPGVVKAFSVIGRFDVVILASAPDVKGVTDVVLRLHEVPGVLATETLVEAAI